MPLRQKVFCHVGMTKAASTSIQNTLDYGREALLAQGILFPASCFTRRNPTDLTRTSGNLELLRMLKNGTEGAFIEECRQHEDRAESLVLSAENLLFDQSEGQLEPLARLLESTEVVMIAVVRHQIDWLVSRYTESVTGGWHNECRSIDRYCRDRMVDGVLDYGKRVAWLAKLLNAQTVHVLDYGSLTRDGKLVSTVLDLCGVDQARFREDTRDDMALSRARSDNRRSVSATAIEAQRSLNVFTDILPPRNRVTWLSERRLEWKSGADNPHETAALLPSPKTLRDLEKHVAPFNAKLSDRYLGGADFESQTDNLQDGLIRRQLSRRRLTDQFVRGMQGFLEIRDMADRQPVKVDRFPPPLTAPAEEVTRLCALYRRASVILECPSGYMTLIAAGLPDKRIMTLEPDPVKRAALIEFLDCMEPLGRIDVHHQAQPLNIWNHEHFQPPDMIHLGPDSAAHVEDLVALTQNEVKIAIEDASGSSLAALDIPRLREKRRTGTLWELHIDAR
ncbi:hypothetical protein ACFSUD_18755 [Sulfitobacter aestuarii]|uniref:Sulfotransferase family protein n=1 Tax=Sulfitobacter aestuarii TaxID=2161676 RepID=A0ABW5U8E7_9RHOB